MWLEELGWQRNSANYHFGQMGYRLRKLSQRLHPHNASAERRQQERGPRTAKTCTVARRLQQRSAGKGLFNKPHHAFQLSRVRALRNPHVGQTEKQSSDHAQNCTPRSLQIRPSACGSVVEGETHLQPATASATRKSSAMWGCLLTTRRAARTKALERSKSRVTIRSRS